MALNNQGLGFLVAAKDMASAVFQKVGKSLGVMSKKGDDAGVSLDEAGGKVKDIGMKMMGAGIAGLAAMGGLAYHAGNFETAIAKAGAFTGGTTEEIEKLRNAAKNLDLAKKGFSFTEQAETLATLANETGNADDAVNELAPSLNLAKITGMQGAQAAGFLADAVAGFGGSSKDAQKFVDKMAFSMKAFGLTASELEPAIMPTIGAAKLIGASFDDTLAVVGLTNSVLGNTKKSAMAATMAMNQLADPKTHAELKGLGVEVKGLDGKFRGLPDILADVATKTAGMSESQKAAKLESIFGAKAAGGLNIVMEALSKGVKDAAGNTLTGAAAVEELRKQMQNSGGAADSMASAMGGGFLGALKEIKASFSSLGEELGEGFGNALAPILRGIAQVARGITSFIKLIPGPVKTALAGLALAGATFLTFAGGVVAATGAVMGLIAAKAVLIAALKVIGVVLAATAAVMLPLILLSAGLYVAWTNNIGGIADKVTGWLKKIQLAFEAVQQLFSTGQFSGDVLAELNNGNEGIKNFAITLFVWFNRIKNFFVGFGTGFSAAIDAAAPTIDRFIKALERLFAAFMPAKEAPDEAKAKFEAFGAAGARVGDALGKVFDFLLSAITAVIDVTTGIVEGFSAATSVGGGLTGIITTLSLVFTDVVNALTGTEAATADTASGWQTLGNVVGFVAGLVVQAIQLMVTQWAIMAGVVSGVVGAIRSYLMSIFNVVINVVNLIADALAGNWDNVWDDAKMIVFSAVEGMVGILESLLGIVLGTVDKIGAAFGKDLGLRAALAGGKADMMKDLRSGMGLKPEAGPAKAAPVRTGVTTVQPAGFIGPPPPPGASNAPGVAAAAGQAQTTSALASLAAAQAKPPPPTTINLKSTLTVDGAVLAEVVQKHMGAAGARGFGPTTAPA